MKVKLTKEEKENLSFILFQFIDTHEQSVDIYEGELKIAKRILKLLKVYEA